MKRKIDASATADSNGEFFCIYTTSRGLLGYVEPGALPHYLAPDVSNEVLGRTLRVALRASKTVGVEEFQKIFQSGVIQRLAEDRESNAMKRYGYKTRQALYKNRDSCWISVVGEVIEIKPTHHKTLDGYSGISQDGPEILRVAISAPDADLGAALREGFSRCTSSFKQRIDLQASGALIAGGRVEMALSGDFTNQGTVRGAQVDIEAHNIANSGSLQCRATRLERCAKRWPTAISSETGSRHWMANAVPTVLTGGEGGEQPGAARRHRVQLTVPGRTPTHGQQLATNSIEIPPVIPRAQVELELKFIKFSVKPAVGEKR